jgi:hypothetical protein
MTAVVPHMSSALYFQRCAVAQGAASGNGAAREIAVKKLLGIFALFGAVAAAVMFWRRRKDDDEFLDEELQ